MQNAKYIAWAVFAGVIIIGLLWNAERRTDALMAVGECVEKKVQEDGFSGAVDKAWETYAESCANGQ